MKIRTGNPGWTFRRLLSVYLPVVAALLLWNFFHGRETVLVTRDVSIESMTVSAKDISDYGDVDAFELLDGTPFSVHLKEDASQGAENDAKLRGVALLGYENRKGLRFSDETIRCMVSASGGGEENGRTVLLLKNQTPYSQDETMVYLAFPEALDLRPSDSCDILFYTDGLVRNGILFSGEPAAEGEKSATVIARLYYEKTVVHPFRAFLLFLAEAAAAFLCLLYAGRAGGKTAGDPSDETAAHDSRLKGLNQGDEVLWSVRGDVVVSDRRGFLRGMTAKKLAIPAAVLLGCFLVMGYTWKQAVSETAAGAGAEYLVTGTLEKERLELREGEVLKQTILPREDALSALGIRFRLPEGKSFPKNANLFWRLTDEEGTSVSLGSARAGDLETADSVIGEKAAEEEVLKAASFYLLLPLEEPVRGSAGKRFTLELTVEDAESVPLQVSRGGNLRASVEGKEEDFELCALGIYQNNGFLKGFFGRLCIWLLAALAGLYAAARILRGRTAQMYLICALVLGVTISFLTPAYTVPDERAHIDTAYFLSNRFLGIRDDAGPDRLMKRACDVDMSVYNWEEISLTRYRAQTALFGAADHEGRKKTGQDAGGQSGSASLPEPASGTELTPVYARNTLHNATVFCYLPAAAGLTAGRLLGRNMITMIMLARWMNLLACALLFFFAIRRIPFGGNALAVIGLFPKTLQLMASCSYDGLIIAGAAVFIAWLTALIWEDTCPASDYVIFLLAAAYMTLVKGGVYLPLLLMVLLFVRQKGDRTARLRSLQDSLLILGGAAALFFVRHIGTVLSMFLRESGSATLYAGERTLYSLSDFLTDPLRLVHIFLNTVYTVGDDLVTGMVGRDLAAKNVIVFSFYLLMLLGAVKKSGEKVHFTTAARALTLAAVCMSTGLIALSMLLAFTPVGAAYIMGIQGRYFLPLLPAVVLAAENGIVRSDRIEGTFLLYAETVLVTVTFCEILLGCFAAM